MLLIEDDKIRQDQLSALLTQFNHSHRSVADVQAAVGFFETGGYARVLIASYTPGLLGELDRIRGLQAGYLPVLLICDQLDDAIVDACGSWEVDGVVVRPIDHFLLKSTLISVLRMGQVRAYQQQQSKQLLEHWRRIDQEHEVAVKIYNNVLCKNLLITEVVRSVISPMALFNGDVLFVAKSPENHLHLLLGDFTGHGLSASIAAIPTADMFYGMTQKGFELSDIVSEINGKLYKMLPTNMFLAATAAALYPDSNSLSLITCGLPEHFLVDKRDGSYRIITSKNIPLGIQASCTLHEQHFSVTGDQQLFMFTDGVFEAENEMGEAFGSERIIQAICHSQTGLDDLRAKLDEHCLNLGQQDDISLVKLICDVENVPWRSEEPRRQDQTMRATTWKSCMEFEIDSLQAISPVPVMVNALMDIQGLQDHRQSIFIIVNELFANALDHGLLELDSQIKNTPEGFMNFYLLKEERLQNCNQGRIRFQFSHQPLEQGGRLIIKVIDSGAGFDWQQLQQRNLEQNSSFSGRGLKLLETLCSSISYHGKGNRVTAVFDW